MEVSPGSKLKEKSTKYRSFDAFHLSNGIKDSDQLQGRVPVKPLEPLDPRDPQDVSTLDPTLMLVVTSSIIFTVGATIALVLHIYIREHVVLSPGLLLCDHELCRALGQTVLRRGGSSVDAAVAAALCLAVVHPHVSGVGGGGVMMVHDIHRNQTRVLDFQEKFPRMLREEMSEQKPGLRVGVPGVMKGLGHAHRLYGSLSWKELAAPAASLAREGFKVSYSLAEAIAQVQAEHLSDRFRAMFLPEGRPPGQGSVLRTPGLAAVLEAGMSGFYGGDTAQEIEDEVRAHGGVMSDIRTFSVEVDEPVEGRHEDFVVQAPPSCGAAFMLALQLSTSFRERHVTLNASQSWSVQALKSTLAFMEKLSADASLTDLLSDTLRYFNRSEDQDLSSYEARATGQVAVMGSDDLLVLLGSSSSRAFGSRIVTRSGIVLNGAAAATGSQAGEKPVLALMPIIVVPLRRRCGTYLALSCSGRCSLKTLNKVFADLSDQDDTLQENNTRLERRTLLWGVSRRRDAFAAIAA